METNDETARIRTRHRDWYLALAERAAATEGTAEQDEWLRLLEVESDNLQAALEWSQADPVGAEANIRLAAALRLFWELRGRFTEARHQVDAALAREEAVSDAVRASALISAGQLATYLGEYEPAARFFTESLGLWMAASDREGIAEATTHLGYLAQTQGETARAMAYHGESLAIWRELGNVAQIANALTNLGLGALLSGDFLRARALCEESLAIGIPLGDKRARADALQGLAFARFCLGQVAEAMAPLHESIRLLDEWPDKPLFARGLEAAAFFAAMTGQARRAAVLFGAAESLRQAIDVPMVPAYRHLYDQALNAMRRVISEADFAGAWAEGRRMTLRQAMDFVLAEG